LATAGFIMTEFTSIKFVEDAFRNNLRTSTGVTVWTCVTAFFAGIMRNVTRFYVALPLVTKCESTIMSRRGNARVWIGNTAGIACEKEVKISVN
jgi:hypothetical protein